MNLRTPVVLGIISLLGLSSSLQAQVGTAYLTDSSIGDQTSGSLYTVAPVGVQGGWFWVRGDYGQRPGVEGNWFSTGGFAPIQPFGPESAFFIDGQMWVTGESNVGSDVGIGYRHMVEPMNSIFGINSFITWDKSQNDLSYRQYGFGAEWLTPYVTAYFNSYLAWNPGEVNNLGGLVRTNQTFFQGKNLVFMNFQNGEEQLEGVDFMVGSAIPGASWLSLFGGFYHFDAEAARDFTGFQGQAQINLTNALIDFTVYHDDVFGTTFNVGTQLILGEGMPQFVPYQRSLATRMYNAVQKRHRILTERVMIDTEELAINPATGLPYIFLHADNTGTGNGNGTFEQPFTNLQFANGVNGDIILVHRGTTDINNPLPAGTGLQLQDNQIVLGEGTPFLLQTANRENPIPLPGFASTGPHPFVDGNAGATIFTLADNNQILGLNILTTANGLAIGGSNVNNFTIRDINTDLGANTSGAGGGIYLTNASGTGIIENVGFRMTSPLAAGGIRIENNGTAPLDLVIQDIPFLSGGQYGVRLIAANSSIQTLIDNVQADANGRGLELTAVNNGQLSASVVDSSFTNATADYGILVRGNNGGDSQVSIQNVDASGANTDGLNVQAFDGTVLLAMQNSTLSGAGGDAVNVMTTGSNGLAQVGIAATTGTGAGGAGVALDARNLSTAAVSVTDSDFSGATGDGVMAFSTTGGLASISTSNANFANAGGNGLAATATVGGEFQGNFLNSSLANAGQSGVLVMLDAATGLLTLDNTDANSAGDDGLHVEAVDGSTFNGSLLNGVSLDDAGQNAIVLAAMNTSDITLTGTGVSGANAGTNGIVAVAQTGSVVDLNLASTGSFASAGGDAVNFAAADNSDVRITISGDVVPADFSGAGGNGVIGTLDDSIADLNLTNTNFNGATADGINVVASNGSSFNTNLVNSTFDNAGANGFIGVLDTGSTATINMTGSSFDGAAADGLHLTAQNQDGSGNGSAFAGTIDTTSFANAGANALEFDLTNLNGAASGLNFTDSTMNDATLDAINIVAATNSLFGLHITDGDLSSPGDDVLDATVSGGSFVNVVVDPTDATGAGDNGIEFNVTGTNSRLDVAFIDSPLSTAANPVGNNGVIGNVSGTNALVNLTLDNSELSNAANFGINVAASGGSAFNATITDSPINNSGQQAFALTLDNSTSVLAFTNSSLANSVAGHNVSIAANNGSTVSGTFTNSSLAGAGLDGLLVSLNNSTGSFTLDNGSDADNAGRHGLNFSAINGSSLSATLNDTSMDGATQDGLHVTSDNSTISLAGTGLSADNTGQDGFDISLTNGSLGSINFDGVSGDGNTGDGFKLLVDASTLVGSSINNATFNDNGVAGVDGSVGIRITSINNAEIGQRAGQLGGISFQNVTAGNTVANMKTQDNGLKVLAETNGYVGLGFDDAHFDQNEGSGVQVDVNPDASANDTALAILNFQNSTISRNFGDGATLNATNGNDMLGNPQTTGIIFTFQDGQINDNGNFINDPGTGIIGDGIGYGINAFADGDGSVVGNTQITLNLINADLVGNEEGSINPAQQDGGVVNLNINGGTIDIAGLNVICADGPMDVRSLSLNNVTLNANPAGPGFVFCAENGGQVIGSLSNLTIENNAGTGIVTSAITGGDVSVTLNNIIIQNNGTLADPETGLAATAALQSRVDGMGSTTTLNITDLTIADNPLKAIGATITGGGVYNLTMDNVTSTNNTEAAGEGALDVQVTGAGSTANLDINGFSNDASTGKGVNLLASGGGTLNVTQFDNITATNAAEEGLNVVADSLTNFSADTVDVSGAGGNGVNIVVGPSTSSSTISLTNVNADNSAGTGVNISLNNGAAASSSVSLTDVSAVNAAGNGLTSIQTGAGPTSLSITNSNFDGAGFDGVHVEMNATGASTGTVSMNGVTATGAANEAFDILLTGPINISNMDLSGLTGTGAGANGLLVNAIDPQVVLQNVSVSGSNFNGAGARGIDLDIADQASPVNVSIQGTSADDAVGTGVFVNLANVTGGASTLTIDGLSAQNSQTGNGLDVRVSGLLATDSLSASISNSTFDNANVNGVNFNVGGAAGATATLDMDTVSANDAGSTGVNIFADNTTGISLAVNSFNNISATGAGTIGVNVDARGTAALTAFTADGVDVTDAGTTGLNLFVQNQASTIDLMLHNVLADDAGTAPATSGDGIHVVLDNVGGGATNSIDLDTVQASRAIAGDGLDFTLDNGTVAQFTNFNAVTAQNNQQSGLRFTVDNMSQLLSLAATGLDLSNNSALSTTNAGLLVNVTNGSVADFDLTNLTINNTGANFGKGVFLNVQDTSMLGFDVSGTSLIANTGREGVDIQVGTSTPGATFTGNFTGLDITNSGTAPMVLVNGFDFDVTGAGSSATLTFDDVSSSNNLRGDGFNFLVNGGASLDITMSNGCTASNNGGRGLALLADGAGTNVSLTSMAGGGPVNTFNNNGSLGPAANNGGHGVDIVLQNGNPLNPLVATFDLEASANNNAGTGIRLIANDGSGVQINSLGITASNVNVDNNGGNGLTVDLNNVTGITSFDLSGMQVNDNVGDQINVRFRNMTLNSVNFDQIVADGPGAGAGTGSGLVLTLDNTQITGTLGLNNITAVNNGSDGLQFNLLNGATIPAGSAIDLATGVAVDSRFDNNGRHGINIQLNNSTASLDILNSQAAFGRTSSASNNGGNGINIALQNGSTLTTTIDQQIVDGNAGSGIFITTSGNSTFNGGNSITNSMITNNGSFGIRGTFFGGSLDLSVGSRTTAGQGNLIDGNSDAGIAIDMMTNASGQIAILDNTIINTTDGSNADFDGEGVVIRMLGLINQPPATNLLNANGTGLGDSATVGLANAPGLLIANNDIGMDSNGNDAGNNSFGITFDVEGRSRIDGVHILNNVVANSGRLGSSGAITNGSADGINFRRFDEVVVDDFLIDENMIVSSADDGIEIVGENDNNSPMRVQIGLDGQRDALNNVVNTDIDVRGDVLNWLSTLDGNVIMSNGNDGIALQVNADANLAINMQENRIIQNGDDGIQMTEIVQSAGDQRAITGAWSQNIVSDNTNMGIRMSALTNNLSISDGTVGALIDQFGQIMIDGNGSTGIFDNAVSLDDTFNDLDIIRNGRLQTTDRTVGHGIDFQIPGDLFTQRIVVSNSSILQNFQDGVELSNQGGGSGGFARWTFTNNMVNQNAGRGYDVLNKQNADSNVIITGSIDPRMVGNAPNGSASQNGEEGIYVVNTASGSQGQSDFSNVDLANDGSTTANGRLAVVIDQVDISDNGNTVLATLPNNLTAAGLVVRVGTNDGNYGLLGSSPTDQAGGFASNGSTTVSTSSMFNGGVMLQVTRDNLQGNFGDDTLFHSFVSAPTQAQGGTWDDMNFDPNPASTNRGDPLARLDVVWGTGAETNTFDTVDLQNGFRVGTATGEAGAFYNDADAVFKSRVVNNMTPAIGGPFTSATRRRNATRLALRNYRDFPTQMVIGEDTLFPTATPNPNTALFPFLYPGMGDSTFRVHGTSGNGALVFQSGNGFDQVLFDDDPRNPGGIFTNTSANADFVIDDINDVSGIGFTGANIFGELPFGWGTF